MKKLNIRFEEVTCDKLDDIVDRVGFNRSQVARAALNFGMNHLLESIEKGDSSRASHVIGINSLREIFSESDFNKSKVDREV